MNPIALVMLPCWDAATPPLSVGYLAQYLTSHGLPNQVYDLNVEAYRDADVELWNPMRQALWVDAKLFKQELLPQLTPFIERWAEVLARRELSAVGLSVNAASRLFGIALARQIRAVNPERYLIWGGTGVYNAEELSTIPTQLVDCAVIGEGEETLLEIARFIEAGEPVPDNLPGTALPAVPRYRLNQRRGEIANLDEIPFPTYEGFNLEQYTGGIHSATLLTSRGCPMRCNFCDTALRFRKYRSRSAGSIMAELSYHAGIRRIDAVSFQDAAVNGNPRNLAQLVDAIIDSPMKFVWDGNFFVHRRSTEELYQKMAASGCKRLFYGIESGSDRVLKLMNKRYTSALASQVLRWGHEAGIENFVNFIVGYPGETEEMFEETLSFIEENAGYIDSVMMVTLMFIVPETPVYVMRHQLGITIDEGHHFNWHDNRGNTLEVRKERLHRVLDLIAALKIPILGSSLAEVEIDYCQSEGVKELGPVGRATPAPIGDEVASDASVQLGQVKLTSADGQALEQVAPGAEVVLVIPYQSTERLDAPLFRVQLFNHQNPDHHNVFVFGTNTARCPDPPASIGPGDGEIRLHVEQVNLSPGVYQLTVGLWPDEQAEEAVCAVHGTHCLEVAGLQDPGGHVAFMEVEGSVTPGALDDGEDLHAALVQLTNGDGEPSEIFDVGAPMTARMRCAVTEGLQVWISGVIEHENRIIVHRAGHLGQLAPGVNEVRWRFPALQLQKNDYHFTLCVYEDGTDNLIHTGTASFGVRGTEAQGAGLVHLACSWSHVPADP